MTATATPEDSPIKIRETMSTTVLSLALPTTEVMMEAEVATLETKEEAEVVRIRKEEAHLDSIVIVTSVLNNQDKVLAQDLNKVIIQEVRLLLSRLRVY